MPERMSHDPLRRGRLPFQEQIHAFILDLSEAEPLVEPERGIEAFDVDAKGLPAGGGLCLERAHERRPQAAVAVGGQQGDGRNVAAPIMN